MKYFCVGIKGSGMSTLAQILSDLGNRVSGYDDNKNHTFTEEGLIKRNIKIFYEVGHPIDKDTIVTYSKAFSLEHPELVYLKSLGLKFISYNELLGDLTRKFQTICVCGTHGKTTTSTMISDILKTNIGTNYFIGDGSGYADPKNKLFVIESCEFQRHFLAYHPDYAIITNIELDHIDYYKDINDYVSAYQSFVDQVKKKVVVYGDDPYLPHLHYKVPYVTYGYKEGNDYIAKNIRQGQFGMIFDCYHKDEFLCHIELNEVGDPFLQDALGTFALAYEMGCDVDEILEGLQEYKGIARRFVIEEVKDSVLIDDYAHHPTAIRYMIDSARKKYPDKKVVALYKPDRYSRLQYFLDDFAKSLNTADQVILCDFPKNAKREDETITVTIQDLLQRCPNGKLLDVDEPSAEILKTMCPAVFVFMSSKDIYLLKDMLKEKIEK